VLDARVLAEIRRLLAPGGDILIVGSTAAISATTEQALTSGGFVVTRFGGPDRSAQPTTDYLDALPELFYVYAVGNPAVQAYPIANQVAGMDRYATAVEVARQCFPPPRTDFLATGLNFPDAMSGGALAALVGEPVLLTGPTSVPSSVRTFVDRACGSESAVVAFGSAGVVSGAVLAEVAILADRKEPGAP
jgi:hypothetical protein